MKRGGTELVGVSKRRRLSQSSESLLDNKSHEPTSVASTQIFAGDRFKSIKRKVPSEPKTTNATTFASLGISSILQNALQSMSIHTPTEVQRACIPAILSGRDCIGNAKTGSGKTIAFALPILQRLSVDPYGIFAVVLTPTRELAFQISDQFVALGTPLNIKTAVIVGGMDMIHQALELKDRPHVVIATPGRLVDHLISSSGEWNLKKACFLILDEADRLLSSTFASDLSEIFKAMNPNRQTCLFTATFTPSIDLIASAEPRPGKDQPFIHRIKERIETVTSLRQHYLLVPSHVREAYLYYILCNPPETTIPLIRKIPAQTRKNHGRPPDASPADEVIQPPPTIIFCAKPRTAAYISAYLKLLTIRNAALHSWLSQKDRLQSLSLFRASVVPVLVSTDVGARGLDIDDVALVINWDLPREAEEYTHRVGRTARAGKGGVAISLVTEHDEERLLGIENRIQTKLSELSLPEDKVLAKLNLVATAKRMANMEIHDSDLGKREKLNKSKAVSR